MPVILLIDVIDDDNGVHGVGMASAVDGVWHGVGVAMHGSGHRRLGRMA